MYYNRYVIKLLGKASGNVKIKKSLSKPIVVSTKKASLNGFFYEKIGVIWLETNYKFGYLNLDRLGYWVNKGAILNRKVSWLAGLLGNYELLLNKKKF